MHMKPITIVGGGLAGLTLGIALRQRGVPAVIWEAGTYPRHRVCGEFISGRGLGVLQRLGLMPSLEQAGARPARTAKLFLSKRDCPAQELPGQALCLSRLALDALLADRFRELGGDLRCGTRWTWPTEGEGVVRATGRQTQAAQSGWRWYGLKAHARNITLEADLEMHFGPNSYVGLCRLAVGVVNVCGLFRRQASDAPLPRNPVERFCQTPSGSLGERLADAEWDEDSFCSVGGLPFRSSLREDSLECRIGDSLAMIPPVTGNGMSMAFESAEAAADPLVAFAEQHSDWNAARGAVSEACRAAFGSRLHRAGWLHAALFQPGFQAGLLPWFASRQFLWRLFFRATAGCPA